MRHEFTIPDWRPAALNELLKAGPWGAARLKRRDRDYLWGYSLEAGIPRHSGRRRRVSLRITLPPRQRRWDLDALLKSTLDGCVAASLLRDDSEAYAAWGGVVYTRGSHLETTVVIEDEEEDRC